jgi:hypothetical protein
MSGLSAQKVQIVRRLVETSPDRVVSALQAALAQTSGEDALADVRRLVEADACAIWCCSPSRRCSAS